MPEYFYYARSLKTSSKSVILKVNSEFYEGYRRLCKDKSLVVSKQFKNFIKEELKKNNKK